MPIDKSTFSLSDTPRRSEKSYVHIDYVFIIDRSHPFSVTQSAAVCVGVGVGRELVNEAFVAGRVGRRPSSDKPKRVALSSGK